MELGMIGLGRMGGSMVQRLARAGHRCVVFDLDPKKRTAVQDAFAQSLATKESVTRKSAKTGEVVVAASLQELASKMQGPRNVWMMVPAAVVDETISGLVTHLKADDVLIDGGNSYYIDDIRRAQELGDKGIHYVDVGTSGGVFGEKRGFCLMYGGEKDTVKRLEPIFADLAPAAESASRTPGRKDAASPAEHGYLHCGPCGAGHFVKMVHNGIEYGVMAAYAEGFNILRHANIGKKPGEVNAETTPLRDPEHYQFDLNLPDIAEVWRRGSVIASWLLDLTAAALLESPDLEAFAGRVSDSGEGRWTVKAAIDEAVPAPVLSAALYGRFSSRGDSDYADKLLSAMRHQFGGHVEKKSETKGQDS